MSVRKTATETLKMAAIDYFVVRKNYAAHVEVSVLPRSRLRVDIMCTSFTGLFTGVEIKSSIEDLRTDKKMHKYVLYCDRFYLCVDHKLFAKHKEYIVSRTKPWGIGVIVLEKSGFARVRVYARKQTGLTPEQKLAFYCKFSWRCANYNKNKHPRRTRRYVE